MGQAGDEALAELTENRDKKTDVLGESFCALLVQLKKRNIFCTETKLTTDSQKWDSIRSGRTLICFSEPVHFHYPRAILTPEIVSEYVLCKGLSV